MPLVRLVRVSHKVTVVVPLPPPDLSTVRSPAMHLVPHKKLFTAESEIDIGAPHAEAAEGEGFPDISGLFCTQYYWAFLLTVKRDTQKDYCIQCGYQPLAVTGRRADDLSILRGPVAQYAFSGPALSPAPAALLTTGASANTRHTSAHRLRTAFIILAAP